MAGPLEVGSYPNPFNSHATIRYNLPIEGHVSLRIFDTLGREVRMLVNRVQEAGMHEIVFDAVNLPSGLYVYRLEAAADAVTGTMLFLK